MVNGSDMARAGIVLNVAAVTIITLAVAVLSSW